MSDIVAFLRAWLDEDEGAARSTIDDHDSGQWEVHGVEWSMTMVRDARTDATIVYNEGSPSRAEAAHIGRWDPARVLAEVAAKRRVLDLCAAIIDTEIGRVGVESHDLAFGILDALALPAADHPDFDPAWRPVTSPVQPHQDPGGTPPDLKS